MAEKKGLGRGLSALLGEIDESVVASDSPSRIKTSDFTKIPVDAIETNPWQPRNEFEQQALEELSQSIKTHGLIQPITVREKKAGVYQLISGERRLRASKMAGLKTIPAYIRTASDMQMIEMALIENIQREDLNPIEVALSLQRLLDECNLTQENLAIKVSKSRPAVANYLRLLRLDKDVQLAVCNRQISMGHAKALVVLEDPAMQKQILQKIIIEDLSTHQVEDLLRKINQEKTNNPVKVKTSLPQSLQFVRESLSKNLDTKVEIKRDLKGKGNLIIKFKSDADLDRILELIQNK